MTEMAEVWTAMISLFERKWGVKPAGADALRVTVPKNVFRLVPETMATPLEPAGMVMGLPQLMLIVGAGVTVTSTVNVLGVAKLGDVAVRPTLAVPSGALRAAATVRVSTAAPPGAMKTLPSTGVRAAETPSGVLAMARLTVSLNPARLVRVIGLLTPDVP